MGVFCKKCFSTDVSKRGFDKGKQRYICNSCKSTFNAFLIDDDKNLYEKVLNNFIKQECGVIKFCESVGICAERYAKICDSIKVFMQKAINNEPFYSGYDDLDDYLRTFVKENLEISKTLSQIGGSVLMSRQKRKLGVSSAAPRRN